MDNIMLSIRKYYTNLRNAERKVADFFLDEEYEIQTLTIDKLATTINVSQPTIIRFSKAIGLHGFKELKWQINNYHQTSTKSPLPEKVTSPISKDDKLIDLPTRIITTNIKLLKDTLKNISNYEFLNAVEAIFKANKIAIFAVENSNNIAQDLHIKLSYIGLNAIYHTDSYLQKILAANLENTDVAISISYSGSSMQTVDSFKIAKKQGATTISITNYEKAIINKYANIMLCTGVEQFLSGQAIFSRCVLTAVIDMLYAGLLLKDFDKHTNTLNKNGKIISDLSY